jgi:hypothetical protein
MVMAVVVRETAHDGALLADDCEQSESGRERPTGPAALSLPLPLGFAGGEEVYPITPVPPVAAITWPCTNSASGLSRYSTREA